MGTRWPRLVFIRPHKTGSTSFHKVISEAYPPEQVCPFPFAYHFKDLPTGALDGYSYFWPHMGIEQARRISSGGFLGTVVRTPQARLLSSYHYWRGQSSLLRQLVGSSSHLHEVACKLRGMSLERFLCSEDPVILRASDNYLLRFFAGGDFGETLRSRTQIFVDGEMNKDAMLDRAVANLSRFDFILVLERFVDSLRLVNDATGLDLPLSQVRVNVSANRASVKMSGLEKDALHDKTRYDDELYRLILSRFEKHL